MENTVVEETRTVTKETTKAPVQLETVTVEETETVRTDVAQVIPPEDTVVVETTKTVVRDTPEPTQQVSWEVKQTVAVTPERLKRSTGPDVVVRVG